jgi:5-methylthioadenosine/S-adenosylhomocysteine deaminase
VDQEDIKIMLDAGVKVAYNPSSNMKLASGVAPVTDMLTAGLTVGLATDSNLSNNNLDLFEEMRVGAMLQKLITLDASALPATEVLKMATIYGAKCLGLEDEIGSLEVGKKADVIIVDLKRPHMWPRFVGEVNNVIANLVYSAGAADVRTTIVDGQLLADEGRLLAVDLKTAYDQVQAAAYDLYRRAQAKMN